MEPLAEMETPAQAIVNLVAARRGEADLVEIYQTLSRRGYPVADLHGATCELVAVGALVWSAGGRLARARNTAPAADLELRSSDPHFGQPPLL